MKLYIDDEYFIHVSFHFTWCVSLLNNMKLSVENGQGMLVQVVKQPDSSSLRLLAIYPTQLTWEVESTQKRKEKEKKII